MNRLYTREPDLRRLPELVGAIQRNCDISDARHAGDYGLCTFLLRMREYYRWEMEVPFSRRLAKDDLGDWLDGRERHWSALEEEPFANLPLGRAGLDPFETARANRALMPRGLVYSAGLGRFGKPVFFLGRLLGVQERAGLKVIVSSCEYARELAAPPAMLLGRTVFIRRESVRRALWERLEEWRWRKLDAAASLALAGCELETDTDRALERLADRETETMILHEIGEARAGELLGSAWGEMMQSLARTPAEPFARAVRDLLADCISTLPALIGRADPGALHFYFATFDAPRRELFPRPSRPTASSRATAIAQRFAELLPRVASAGSRPRENGLRSIRPRARRRVGALLAQDAPQSCGALTPRRPPAPRSDR